MIDLDTVMPGLSVPDFADLVRRTVSPNPEDEQDLSKVCVRRPMFGALVRGYLEGTGGFLSPLEVSLLPMAAIIITLEIGFRFLTDYLSGDTYFRVHREGQNLDRCRTQFRLAQGLLKCRHELENAVKAHE